MLGVEKKAFGLFLRTPLESEKINKKITMDNSLVINLGFYVLAYWDKL
jgi:hypothetical protein